MPSICMTSGWIRFEKWPMTVSSSPLNWLRVVTSIAPLRVDITNIMGPMSVRGMVALPVRIRSPSSKWRAILVVLLILRLGGL